MPPAGESAQSAGAATGFRANDGAAGVIAFAKFLLVLIAAAMMLAAAVRHREWRGGLLFVACVFLAGAAQECEGALKCVFPSFHEPEMPPTIAFLALGCAFALAYRGSAAPAFAAIWKNRRFPILVWGLLFVSIIPNAAKAKFVWSTFSSLQVGTHAVREVAEAATEFLGCVLLFNWAVLFLKDKWRLFTRRVPSPHEHLLWSNELVPVGHGSRRRAYRIGDTGYCAKFYLPPEECAPGTMKASIRRDIGWRRFSRMYNSSSREVYVYGKLRHVMPQSVRDRMPAVCERVFHPKWGWGVLETFYANPDGSAVQPYIREIARRKSMDEKNLIYCAARDLLMELIAHAAPFYEPGNFHVQELPDGRLVLKIVDFEPDPKVVLPLELLLPFFRRMKLRRKARRFLALLRARYGVTAPVETEIG